MYLASRMSARLFLIGALFFAAIPCQSFAVDDPLVALQKEIVAATAKAVASAGQTGLPQRVSKPARRVHFLVYSLTQDPFSTPGLRDGTTANGRYLAALSTSMSAMFPNNPARVALIQTNGFDVNDFDRDLANLTDVTGDDTIICYMSTHGSYNAVDGHMLYMNDQSAVPRKSFFAKLKNKGARQTIFITDACANVPPTSPSFPIVSGAGAPPTEYAIFDLLFNFQGDLNINGASPPNGSNRLGQEGWYATVNSPDGGGIFTRAFMRVAVYKKSTDWSSFFGNLAGETLNEGNRFINLGAAITTQTPALLNSNGILIP